MKAEDMKKIMFVSYGGGHANIARLVYAKFAESTSIELKVLALTVAKSVFKQHNVPYVLLQDYLDLFEDREQIVEYGTNLAQKFYNPKSQFSFEDMTAYFGIGFRDLVIEYGLEKAKRLFDEFQRKAFCPTHAMKLILEYERPNAVVITCGVRLEMAAGKAANALGIPVVRIADLPEFEPNNCDAITCVMNEYAREFAIKKLGVPSDKVMVTGQPVFENDLVIDENVVNKTREYLCKEKVKKMVLYLEQPGYEETMAYENEIIEIAKKKSDTLFVMKAHPNQELKKDEWLADNVYRTKDMNVCALINNCDLAITNDSTAGLEAVLLGKALISIFTEKTMLDYSKYGISIKNTDIHELEQNVINLLDTKSTESCLLAEGRKKFENRENAVSNIFSVVTNML